MASSIFSSPILLAFFRLAHILDQQFGANEFQETEHLNNLPSKMLVEQNQMENLDLFLSIQTKVYATLKSMLGRYRNINLCSNQH